jgi:hypothetical protein
MSSESQWISWAADRVDGQPGSLGQSPATAFSVVEPELVRAWVEGVNNLVVLSVGSEAELATLRDRIRDRARVVDVHEPDLHDELTAIACDDRARHALSSLPLALRWQSLEHKLRDREATAHA